jgi:two-component system, OmpR family, response regulator ResD
LPGPPQRWPFVDVIHCIAFDEALATLPVVQPHAVFILADCDSAQWLDFVVKTRQVTQAALVVLHDEVDPVERIEAFEFGADECIEAGAPRMEILARVSAILRRTMHPEGLSQSCGCIDIDNGTMEVLVDHKPVDLSPREFQILSMLADNPNVPVRSVELLRCAWGPAFEGESDLLRKSIYRLRRKLGACSSDGRPLIVNTRGTGYTLSAPKP